MKYTTWGKVRGDCGHLHSSSEAASKCCLRDHRACQSQKGYSDRMVYEVTGRADLENYDVTRGPGKRIDFKYLGNDNYGKPRRDFLTNLEGLDDAAFLKQAEQSIWLSGYANNNPHSDYHWQADACYDEADRRGKPDLYQRAYDRAVASCR